MNLAPVTIIGNLTADPELTYTQSDQARLSFSVATNHIWYDAQGQKQEKTSYHNVVAWRYLAENSARTLEKGIGVIIFGRLEQRSYEDKEGNKRSIVEVVAEEVAIATKSLETITRRQRQAGDSDNQQPQRRPQQAPPTSRPQQPPQQRRTRPMTAKATVSGSADEVGFDDGTEPF
jgi:single-strand DNA-binding protein